MPEQKMSQLGASDRVYMGRECGAVRGDGEPIHFRIR